ncbi:Guanylate kinase [Halomicronema hongdechloris C2206]|uniref:Guanylate kinase n=1 Tax=Halomicronema hongdechloris C2206 TaxID=1641165 RepID=A0A1Z3HIX9_9CYAN|nr:guanylate kinase [Halomicronema hongdechloris]ASC70216.1 Guanylate kinase [Halomicronema hongdechloris C2206]
MTHRPSSIANPTHGDNSPPVLSTSPGQLIVFTGPSGVGKGTLLRALLEKHPELHLSVSATTRAPRPGEVHGQHYYFVERADFEQMIRQGDLLEWAEFAGNYYGTPVQSVTVPVQAGHWVVLEIELDGARQIRQRFPGAWQIFILPPSLEELEHRIRQRGQDDEAAITRRLQRAQVEIEAAAEFDLQIVNDDLEVALERLESCLFERLQATPPH